MSAGLSSSPYTETERGPCLVLTRCSWGEHKAQAHIEYHQNSEPHGETVYSDILRIAILIDSISRLINQFFPSCWLFPFLKLHTGSLPHRQGRSWLHNKQFKFLPPNSLLNLPLLNRSYANSLEREIEREARGVRGAYCHRSRRAAAAAGTRSR